MTLDRYILTEVSRPFLGVALLLVGLFVAFSLTRFLTDANEGALDPAAVMQLTGLKAVIALEVLLPIALYIGLIVALGRLYADWEILALRTSGVPERRIVVPAIALAVLVSLAVAALSLWGRPWAYQMMYAAQAAAEANVSAGALRAGQFHVQAEDERVLFFAERDGERMQSMFVRSRNSGGLEVITARSGTLQDADTQARSVLTLQDAEIYRERDQTRRVVASLGELIIRVSRIAPEPVGYRPKAADSTVLWQSATDSDRAELQWRLSTAVSTLLLALTALPLSRAKPRSGRYARVLLAVIIYAVYFNFLGLARSAVEQGTFPWLWWAPAGLAAGLFLSWLTGRRSSWL